MMSISCSTSSSIIAPICDPIIMQVLAPTALSIQTTTSHLFFLTCFYLNNEHLSANRMVAVVARHPDDDSALHIHTSPHSASATPPPPCRHLALLEAHGVRAHMVKAAIVASAGHGHWRRGGEIS